MPPTEPLPVPASARRIQKLLSEQSKVLICAWIIGVMSLIEPHAHTDRHSTVMGNSEEAYWPSSRASRKYLKYKYYISLTVTHSVHRHSTLTRNSEELYGPFSRNSRYQKDQKSFWVAWSPYHLWVLYLSYSHTHTQTVIVCSNFSCRFVFHCPIVLSPHGRVGSEKAMKWPVWIIIVPCGLMAMGRVEIAKSVLLPSLTILCAHGNGKRKLGLGEYIRAKVRKYTNLFSCYLSQCCPKHVMMIFTWSDVLWC